MTDVIPLLFQVDRRKNFIRRAKLKIKSHDFLYEWVAKDIKIRLSEIKRDFQSVLLCGPFTADYFQDIFQSATVFTHSTPEILESHKGLYDCIISVGEMHCANDLPGLLIQFRRALKPDGVLISASAGGETLQELRAALLQSEIQIMGGASPRVYPFTDKQQMAGLMQRAGFALPVVDSEILNVSYRDMFHLLSDIRGMGESNSLTDCHHQFTSSKVFFNASKYYQENFKEVDGRVNASFEIIFTIGWAPHDSQQKPAKRGSGKVSLNEVLG